MQIQFDPKTLEAGEAALIMGMSVAKVAAASRALGQSREQFLEGMAELAAQSWDAALSEKDT